MGDTPRDEPQGGRQQPFWRIGSGSAFVLGALFGLTAFAVYSRSWSDPFALQTTAQTGAPDLHGPYPLVSPAFDTLPAAAALPPSLEVVNGSFGTEAVASTTSEDYQGGVVSKDYVDSDAAESPAEGDEDGGAADKAAVELQGDALADGEYQEVGGVQHFPDTTWCDPSVLLHEPGPRGGEQWPLFQAQLAQEAQTADAEGGIDLVFYGDSISELLRGSVVGVENDLADGIPDVFQQFFSAYNSLVLAIAGDQTGQLWWRFMHGEMLVTHPPKLAVILIGTNDVAASDDCYGEYYVEASVAAYGTRLRGLLDLLLSSTPSTVLLLAIPPRAGPYDAADVRAWPNKYAAFNAGVNSQLQAAAEDLHPRVLFADCTSGLAVGGRMPEELSRDGVHPNAEGMEMVLECLAPIVEELLEGDGSDPTGT